MAERPGNGPLTVPVAATPVGAKPVPQPVTETPSSDERLETIPGTSRLKGVALHVIGRLGAGILVLFGAVTVSFLLVHATGNPATVLAGGSLPASQVQALSKQLGYNRPLLSQYVSYIGGVLHGQFGVSFRYDTPAINSVISALPNTLLLIGVSLSAALILSIAIATSSVLSRNGWADRFWRPVVLVLQGIPDFWIALLLVLLLAVHWHLLPSLGFDGPKTLIMPCIALTVPMLASFTRLLRANLLDFTDSDVAFALRARGLTRREIVLGHSFRNAMATFVSFVALQAGWLIGGTVIVETIFAWPGIGTLLIQRGAGPRPYGCAGHRGCDRGYVHSAQPLGRPGCGLARPAYRAPSGGGRAVSAVTSPAPPARLSRSRLRAAERHWRISGSLKVGVGILVLMVLLSVVGTLIEGSPSAQDFASILKPPGTGKHLLGTDPLGRDVLAWVSAGIRTSLEVALGVVCLSACVGCTIGIVAGFTRGWLDVALMRLADIQLSVPPLPSVHRRVRCRRQQYAQPHHSHCRGWLGALRQAHPRPRPRSA